MAIIRNLNFKKKENNRFYRDFEEKIIDSYEKHINDNCYVLKQSKEKKGNRFEDITLIENNESYFIGRFIVIDDRIEFEVNNKYVLVYTWNFDREKGKVIINNILCLYDINDKTEVVGTFKELGNKFNESFNNQLEFDEKNNDSLVHRSDIERKRRR